MTRSIAFALAILLSLPIVSFGQIRSKTDPLPPVDQPVRPEPPRPRVALPTDTIFTPGARSPTRLPDIVMEDGTRVRRQISELELEEFNEHTRKVFALTRELSVARTEQTIRKNGKDIQKRLSRMIDYLQDEKPEKPKVRPSVPLADAVQQLTALMEVVKPKLADFQRTEKTVLDLKLTRSIIQDLRAAHKLTLAF